MTVPRDAELVAEHVWRCVELVPAGTVVSYGDVAAIVGIGPRQVGRIIGASGGGLPWWRVTNAAGRLPATLLDAALAHWAEEGVEVAPHGQGCRIARHRADLDALAQAYRGACTGLPPLDAAE